MEWCDHFNIKPPFRHGGFIMINMGHILMRNFCHSRKPSITLCPRGRYSLGMEEFPFFFFLFSNVKQLCWNQRCGGLSEIGWMQGCDQW